MRTGVGNDRLALRARSAAAIAAALVVVACGSGGGDGGSGGGPTLFVAIDAPASPSVTTASVDVYGSASCDACREGDVGFGYCPAIDPPRPSGISVAWSNPAAGAHGPAYSAIVGRCACLFSYCFTTYSHRWSATVPLAIGTNDIEVRASDVSGGYGTSAATFTRLPAVVAGATATAGNGEVTLVWDPVPGAATYNVYWATSSDVTPGTKAKIAAVSSPFTHTGLTDGVAYYYTITAVVGNFESPPSPVVWATVGWSTREIGATASSTTRRTASVAADPSGAAHVHYSFDEHLGSAVVNQDLYATNASGLWSAPQLIGHPLEVNSSITLDAGATVHVGYLGFGGLVHAVLGAGGWLPELVDATGWCDAALALDAAGNAHFAYYSSAGDNRLRYASRVGTNWMASDVEAFADAGCGSPRTIALAVDPAGVARIVYAGRAPDYGLKYAINAGGTWSVSTLTTDFTGQVSVAIDGNGVLHVAYASSGGLVYATNPGGAWSFEPLSDTHGCSHAALTVDGAGHAHISYVRARLVPRQPDTGEVGYANNASGSWRLLPIDAATLDPLGIGASDSAIAVDAQGRVHISYFRGGTVWYATNR